MFDVDWVVPMRIYVAFRLSRLFRPIRCEVCIRERKMENGRGDRERKWFENTNKNSQKKQEMENEMKSRKTL